MLGFVIYVIIREISKRFEKRGSCETCPKNYRPKRDGCVDDRLFHSEFISCPPCYTCPYKWKPKYGGCINESTSPAGWIGCPGSERTTRKIIPVSKTSVS